MSLPRHDEVTLYCEDAPGGRTSKILEAALQTLKGEPALGFAQNVRPRGNSSKNDVHVWAKFARREKFRAIALRDRDFLLRPLLDRYRGDAFHKNHDQLKSWPLSRHCIESYLLDEDILSVVLPGVEGAMLRKTIEDLAAARYWLDVARGTIEDFLWRWRQVTRRSIEGRPPDRPVALAAVHGIGGQIREQAATDGTDESLDKHFQALADDMESDGPLCCRVDGKKLITEVEIALRGTHGGTLPPGGLLDALLKRAENQPPAALLVDLRALLDAVPSAWRQL